jgi:hypothetical protein
MEREQIANDLLTPLWQGIASDYKKKYSYSIWQQFEDQIRSAAYTGLLSTFLSKITQRLGIEIEGKFVETIDGVIRSGEDKMVLKSLRDETTMLVLMVRLANEERREELKQKKEARKRKGQDEDIFIQGSPDGALFD